MIGDDSVSSSAANSMSSASPLRRSTRDIKPPKIYNSTDFSKYICCYCAKKLDSSAGKITHERACESRINKIKLKQTNITYTNFFFLIFFVCISVVVKCVLSMFCTLSVFYMSLGGKFM